MLLRKPYPGRNFKNRRKHYLCDRGGYSHLALFGMTAKEWREKNPNLEGNIRDYADVSQLVCLSNLENINALFIKESFGKLQRLEKLNAIAIEQMTVLTADASVKRLKHEAVDSGPRENS